MNSFKAVKNCAHVQLELQSAFHTPEVDYDLFSRFL